MVPTTAKNRHTYIQTINPHKLYLSRDEMRKIYFLNHLAEHMQTLICEEDPYEFQFSVMFVNFIFLLCVLLILLNSK